MRTEKKFRGILKTVLSFVLVFAIAFAFVNPMTVSAKTKNIKVKYRDFTTSVGTAAKKATTVKTGNYRVAIDGKKGWHRGYVRFTAPKSKTYSFTFSEISSDSGQYTNGYAYIMRIKNNHISSSRVSTQGGKNSTLWFSNEDHGKGVTAWRTSRTGKTHINQGETVYLYLSLLESSSKKAYLTLNIK